MGMAFGSVMRERMGQGLGNSLRLLLSNTLLVSRDWELSISDITPLIVFISYIELIKGFF